MFKSGAHIYLTFILFLISYNSALVTGYYDLISPSMLKLFCNVSIFGFAISISVMALPNNKSFYDIEWLKISICTLLIVFVTISAYNVFQIQNIRVRLFTFNLLVLIFAIYFIIKADSNANL